VSNVLIAIGVIVQLYCMIGGAVLVAIVVAFLVTE